MLRNTVEFVGHFDSRSFHDRRCDITDVVVLAANLALGFDAVWPVHHEVILLTASMHALLEVAERRITGHRPAGVVMRIGVLAAPVIEVSQVCFQICLHAVQNVGLVERTRESTFAGRTIVGSHENQRIVQLTNALKLGNDTTDLQVNPFHLCGKHFHLPCIKHFLFVAQRVPGGNFIDALGQLRIRRNDAQGYLPLETFLTSLVPAHVELALVLIDVAIGRVMRRMHRTGCPEHHERQVRLD